MPRGKGPGTWEAYRKGFEDGMQTMERVLKAYSGAVHAERVHTTPGQTDPLPFVVKDEAMERRIEDDLLGRGSTADAPFGDNIDGLGM